MAERRFSPTATLRIERRGEGDESRPVIVGHASVFDQWTTLYEGRYWSWREVIRPGAYRNAIKEKQDVRALWNHDANYVLGRTTSGTLTLREDEVGLWTETDAPNTQTIRDIVLAPMIRGDVTGMSFAFNIRKGDERKERTLKDGTRVIENGGERVTLRMDGEKLIEERELLDLDLSDVSPVTYPAYEGTDVSLRSVPNLEARIAEMDRPHVRPAPLREQWRRRLAK
jgi:uncharacterized protein